MRGYLTADNDNTLACNICAKVASFSALTSSFENRLPLLTGSPLIQMNVASLPAVKFKWPKVADLSTWHGIFWQYMFILSVSHSFDLISSDLYCPLLFPLPLSLPARLLACLTYARVKVALVLCLSLSVSVSVCPVCPSVCLSVSVSLCLSLSVSIGLSLCLSTQRKDVATKVACFMEHGSPCCLQSPDVAGSQQSLAQTGPSVSLVGVHMILSGACHVPSNQQTRRLKSCSTFNFSFSWHGPQASEKSCWSVLESGRPERTRALKRLCSLHFSGCLILLYVMLPVGMHFLWELFPSNVVLATAPPVSNV